VSILLALVTRSTEKGKQRNSSLALSEFTTKASAAKASPETKCKKLVFASHCFVIAHRLPRRKLLPQIWTFDPVPASASVNKFHLF
jgi:hypothetical protein